MQSVTRNASLHQADNVVDAQYLDASELESWPGTPEGSLAAIICINVVHISPGRRPPPAAPQTAFAPCSHNYHNQPAVTATLIPPTLQLPSRPPSPLSAPVRAVHLLS